MISLLPGTTPQDAQGLVALLALVADPAASQKRVKELVEAAQKLDETIRSHGDAHAAAVAAQSEADKAHASLADREAAVSAREAAAAERHANLNARESGISDREKAHAEMVSKETAAIDQAKADILAKTDEARRAHERAGADAAAAAAVRAELEAKVAKIKSTLSEA